MPNKYFAGLTVLNNNQTQYLSEILKLQIQNEMLFEGEMQCTNF